MRRNVEMQLIVREKFFVAAAVAKKKKERESGWNQGNGHKDAPGCAAGGKQQREKTLQAFRLT